MERGRKDVIVKLGEKPMASTTNILNQLKAKADSDNLEGMARFGMTVEKRLGVSVPDLRLLAKETGKDHSLSLKLWKTGIAEARIVASMIADPAELTGKDMDEWVKDFNSWDVCDQVCMNLFEKTPLASQKIFEWSEREEEYIKRAAFALIACLAWHDKQAADQKFIEFLPVITRGATDQRNFVKKAVNWALRNIGKRNPRLNKAAIKTAREIQHLDSKAARWIAADAIRELEGEGTQKRLLKHNGVRVGGVKRQISQ
jgi:3-methyladenine DNA glycosylase AlkD